MKAATIAIVTAGCAVVKAPAPGKSGYFYRGEILPTWVDAETIARLSRDHAIRLVTITETDLNA